MTGTAVIGVTAVATEVTLVVAAIALPVSPNIATIVNTIAK